MSDSTKAFLLLVLATALFIGSLYWLYLELQPALEHLEQHGLKSVFETLWCGQEGCGSQEIDQ